MIPLRTYHREWKPEGPVEIDWTHPLAQGLRRYVPLNEGAGLPFDYVNGERATLQSVAPDWGIRDGIRAPWFSGATNQQAGWGLSNIFPLTAMTMLATVCRTGVTSYNHVASQWPGYGFAQLGNLHLSFSVNAGVAVKHVSMGIPTENEWHTFCGTWDGATQSGYRDAQLIASTPQTGVIPKSEPFRIGRYQGSNTTTYNGFIGIVAIWDRALSPAEVAWATAEPYALTRPVIRHLFFPVSHSQPTVEITHGLSLAYNASPATERRAPVEVATEISTTRPLVTDASTRFVVNQDFVSAFLQAIAALDVVALETLAPIKVTHVLTADSQRCIDVDVAMAFETVAGMIVTPDMPATWSIKLANDPALAVDAATTAGIEMGGTFEHLVSRATDTALAIEWLGDAVFEVQRPLAIDHFASLSWSATTPAETLHSTIADRNIPVANPTVIVTSLALPLALSGDVHLTRDFVVEQLTSVLGEGIIPADWSELIIVEQAVPVVYSGSALMVEGKGRLFSVEGRGRTFGDSGQSRVFTASGRARFFPARRTN